MRVTVTQMVRRTGIGTPALKRLVRHVMRREHVPAEVALSIAFVSDAVLRRLNRRYLRRDRPTDVLAFPLGAPGTGPLLGEVIISVDRARVQAHAAGHSLRAELALLAAHGVLHLLGYDDRTRQAAARMARRQRQLVTEAGFEVRA